MSDISQVRAIYCDSHGSNYWGIPYRLRPMQEPRDLLRGKRPHPAIRGRMVSVCPGSLGWINLRGRVDFLATWGEKWARKHLGLPEQGGPDALPLGPGEWVALDLDRETMCRAMEMHTKQALYGRGAEQERARECFWSLWMAGGANNPQFTPLAYATEAPHSMSRPVVVMEQGYPGVRWHTFQLREGSLPLCLYDGGPGVFYGCPPHGEADLEQAIVDAASAARSTIERHQKEIEEASARNYSRHLQEARASWVKNR